MNIFISTIISGLVSYVVTATLFKRKLVFEKVYLHRVTSLEKTWIFAHKFRRAIIDARWALGNGTQEEKTKTQATLIEAQNKFKESFEDNSIYFKKQTTENFKSLLYSGLSSFTQGDLDKFYKLLEVAEDDIRSTLQSSNL